MDKLRYLIVLILISIVNASHSQDLLLHFSFGGDGNINPFKSVIDDNNNIYVLGTFDGEVDYNTGVKSSHGGNDVFVMKINPATSVEWFVQIGNPSADFAADIDISNSYDSLYVIGTYLGTCDIGGVKNITSEGSYDSYLACFDANTGNLSSVLNIGGSNVQFIYSMHLDHLDNILLGGKFVDILKLGANEYLPDTFSINSFLVQIEPDHNVNWLKKYPTKTPPGHIYEIASTPNYYYCAGNYKDSTYFGDSTFYSATSEMYVMQTDLSGNMNWILNNTGGGEDFFIYCEVDNNENIYVSGLFNSTDLSIDSTAIDKVTSTLSTNGDNDFFLSKISAGGVLQWYDHEGSIGDDRLTRLTTDNTSIVIAGQYAGPLEFRNEVIEPVGGTDGLGLIYDMDGKILYTITMDGNGTDITGTAAIDNEGYYYLIGDFTSDTIYFDDNNYLVNSNPGTKDMFIAKYEKIQYYMLYPYNIFIRKP